MDRLSVLCFAGTYALALLCELARLALHAAGRWVWTVALIAVGLVVHSLYLVNLGLQTHAVPITTLFESMLVLGWVLAAIALYLAVRSARQRPTIASLSVLFLALVVLTVGGAWAQRGGGGSDWSGSIRFWGGIHGIFQVFGAVFTSLAFVFGLMYMGQSWRLKRKRSTAIGLVLPSLEQSERWHRGAITLAFPFLTAGLITGVGLVIATHGERGPNLQWSDPKIISTFALWVVFAVLMHARYRPDWRGRQVMILTIVAFVFLSFAMVGVGLIFPTRHGGLATQQDAEASAAPSSGSLP
jgi:ABC-type uncharacterized transport system permease subunit